MSKLLTLEQTKNNLIAWREQRNEEALVLLITHNLGLVGFFAKKYINKGIEYDDLCSVGKEGLFIAINKFDYINYSVESFTSYVCAVINNQIREELIKYYKHSHVVSFEQSIVQNKNGNDIKIEDLIGTDSEQLIQDAINIIKKDAIKEVMQCLTPRQREIILLRYGLNGSDCMKQEELAEMYGCSKQWISVQEKRALVKMRQPQNLIKLSDFV